MAFVVKKLEETCLYQSHFGSSDSSIVAGH